MAECLCQRVLIFMVFTSPQIIGAPSFFPTVWGWIKGWFDPVTVSKICVIPQGEETKRLSELMELDDIPKGYGGNLDWEPGMAPDMDKAARQEVEKNGSKGWIDGPCLWQYNQRVPVGTQNGKPRRPTDLKPVGSTSLSTALKPTSPSPPQPQTRSRHPSPARVPVPSLNARPDLAATKTPSSISVLSGPESRSRSPAASVSGRAPAQAPPATAAVAPAAAAMLPTSSTSSLALNNNSTSDLTNANSSSNNVSFPQQRANVAHVEKDSAAAAAAAAATVASHHHHHNTHFDPETANTAGNPSIVVTNGGGEIMPSPSPPSTKKKPPMERFVTAYE